MSNNARHDGEFADSHPHLAANLPFQRRSGPGGRVSVPRILEAVVIAMLAAVITSLMTFVVTQAVIETKLEGIERSLQEIKDEQRRMRGDLYRPRYRDGVYRHDIDGYGSDKFAQ